MPRSGPGAPIGRPLSRTCPPVAGSKPPTMCRNVLLPQPEGPTMETNSCSSTDSDNRSIAVMARLSPVNVLSRSLTSKRGIAALSSDRFCPSDSFRQITEINQRSNIHLLLLKTGLDLKLLHLRERFDIDAQARIAIIILHCQVGVGIHPDHLAVDEEPAGLVRLFEVEPRRGLKIGKEGSHRLGVLP